MEAQKKKTTHLSSKEPVSNSKNSSFKEDAKESKEAPPNVKKTFKEEAPKGLEVIKENAKAEPVQQE